MAFKDHQGNPIGPLRVWLKKEDIPGLAMTRSLGDSVAAKVGVIGKPEILEYQLTKHDKMIVIASDGIWEFMNNNDVASIVYPYYEANNAEGAAEALVREAYLHWKRVSERVPLTILYFNGTGRGRDRRHHVSCNIPGHEIRQSEVSLHKILHI